MASLPDGPSPSSSIRPAAAAAFDPVSLLRVTNG